MGHSFYMDTYYQLSDPTKEKMYLEAESHLTFSDFTEVEHKITNLTVKCNELESTVLGLKQYIQNHSINPPKELVSNTEF